MKFSAVIFDKDGVIIDTQPIHYQVFKGFCHEFNWDISEDQYESYIGMTCADLFFEIKQLYQVQYTVSELVERFQTRYLQAIDASPGIEPIKGVVPLIERLHKEGFKLALASSATREKIELVLNRFGLKSYFSVIVSGYEVNKSKPAPDIFLKAAELLGVPADECVVIEDSANGITAANAANMHSIGYQNPLGKQNLKHADRIVVDFSELNESDFIARNP